jgi:hypothetical protein
MPDLTDLIQQMIEDPDFAQRVVNDPRQFQSEFALNDKAVIALKSLYLEDIETVRSSISNARDFAEGVSFLGNKVTWALKPLRAPSSTEEDEAECYYSG